MSYCLRISSKNMFLFFGPEAMVLLFSCQNRYYNSRWLSALWFLNQERRMVFILRSFVSFCVFIFQRKNRSVQILLILIRFPIWIPYGISYMHYPRRFTGGGDSYRHFIWDYHKWTKYIKIVISQCRIKIVQRFWTQNHHTNLIYL